MINKKNKNIKIKDIMRLFFKYDIDFLPVIDGRNKLRGFIFKNSLINDATETDFINKTFSSLTSKYILLPDESEFLSLIKNLEDTLEFPVLNLKGEVLELWKKKDLVNVFYNIPSSSKKEENNDNLKKINEKIVKYIFNNLPINILMIDGNNKIIYANQKLLEEMDFREEIILNQKITKIFPSLNIIKTKNNLYPVYHNISYQHRKWSYTIIDISKILEGVYCYIFEIKKDADISLKRKAVEKDVEKKNIKNKKLPDIIKESERDIIINALKEHNWNISATARYLKIPRQTLQYKINKYKIGLNEKV